MRQRIARKRGVESAAAAAAAQVVTGQKIGPVSAQRRPDTTVSIVQRVLPDYRIALFQRLHELLAERHIRLRVLYGDELQGTTPRTVHVDAPWAKWIANRYWRLGAYEAVWQPCLRALRGSDLIVVEQANRLLLNHLLFTLRSSRRRVALWGHGMNFQATNRDSLSERWKRRAVHDAHWWFPYTNASARIVEQLGYPSDRITVVNNAVDASQLSHAVAAIDATERKRIAASLGISDARVGLYCGRLVPEKRLDLVFATAHAVRAMVPNFSLVIVGDGPLAPLVLEQAERHSWIRFVGRQVGAAAAPYFAIADILLMPGAIGLVLVDAFAAGIPVVTSRITAHGPEIEYLEPGVNGLMVEADPRVMARACARLLRAPTDLVRMREGCRASATRYTVDSMAQRFADGIESALRA
jgi:glycosyltransferase involved in cell wall biosynthesis